ncbi:MAG: 3-oxoacyl-ACP synthase III family protein [Maritimibacter sp.]
MKPIVFAGTGHALPSKRLHSDDIDRDLGREVGSLRKATGVSTRYFASDESQIDLAIRAAKSALFEAEISPQDIDLVLFASGVPYQTLPATAPLIMAGLGLADGQAAAFDVNSTCLSFVTALDIAALKLVAKDANSVLVVSSEIASRALPWRDDPEVAALFGDGAAAAVLTRGRAETGLCAHLMRSFPSSYDACTIRAGGTRIDFHNAPEMFAENAWFRMDGKELFRVTAKHFRPFVADLLEKAGWTLDDVDLVVPHQASPFALEHMIRQLKLDPEKVANYAADIGNQIAASIPTTLDKARQEGRVPKGTKVLMLGTSAGVSFGGAAVQF